MMKESNAVKSFDGVESADAALMFLPSVPGLSQAGQHPPMQWLIPSSHARSDML